MEDKSGWITHELAFDHAQQQRLVLSCLVCSRACFPVTFLYVFPFVSLSLKFRV